MPDTTPATPRRVRTHHIRQWKVEGRRWAMLTAYDMHAAAVFEEAGIPALLVGDSASNNVLGNETSLPVTLDELIPMVRAVTRSVHRPLVIADLPFGSYEADDADAVRSAVRLMKEGGAQAVKLEGGRRMASRVRAITRAGIPVMGHVGFTPQSEHAIGGYRVQGRGEASEAVVADAAAVEEAGAFAVVLEMVPSAVAHRITETVGIATIGIGAGPHCDAQVLIWQDMAGLGTSTHLTFVKRYAELRATLRDAARTYASEVEGGEFPGPEHSFDR